MPENWNAYEQGPNLGLLFYRRIYRQKEVLDKLRFKESEDGDCLEFDVTNDEKQTPFDAFYKSLFNFKTSSYNHVVNPAAVQRFTLYTTYPGLLSGSGYTHDTNTKGDVKIGFFFDHTSGQPLIPGSSIKGIIRHVFELDEDEKGNKCTGSESLEAIGFFIEEIGESGFEISVNDLTELKSEIFGDQDNVGIDTFFDAVLDIEKSGDKKILGNDFITPHINREKPELSPFSNPNPIQFIKVLPGIGFEFRFRLTDSRKYTKWTGELKSKLFRKIILTLGIGAKTNVGYGQFDENIPVDHKSDTKKRGVNPAKVITGVTKPKEIILPGSKSFAKVKNGDKITGTVIDNPNGELYFKVEVEGDYQVKPVRYPSSSDIKIGRKAVLEVANKQKEKSKWMLTLKNPIFLPE
jgi:CRISPR-associated protein Cmr6